LDTVCVVQTAVAEIAAGNKLDSADLCNMLWFSPCHNFDAMLQANFLPAYYAAVRQL